MAPATRYRTPGRFADKLLGNAEQNIEGLAEKLDLGFRKEREPALDFETSWIQERQNQLVMLDTFFSALRREGSLCFFYAKRTPLSEDRRRVIVGVGRVLDVGGAQDYHYAPGASPDSLKGVIWERNVHHSIRPDFTDGFVFPMEQILEAAEKEPDRVDPERYLAFAPDEHWDEFSFATAHVSHDGAIAALLSCADALRAIEKDFPGPWGRCLEWISAQLNRLWSMRGPYPGFGSALAAFGIPHANLVAYEIALQQERDGKTWNGDPWSFFERLLQDPTLLPNGAARDLGKGFQRMWTSLDEDRRALLMLLSRFTLTEAQANRWYNERHKQKISATEREILKNPYLIFEQDRRQLDPIPLGIIDRGMFPDQVVNEKHPLPPPSAPEDAADSRRARAFAVEALTQAADEHGHTLLPSQWLQDAVQARIAEPRCPFTQDLLNAVKPSFSPVIQTVSLTDGEAFQLSELSEAGKVIKQKVEARSRPPRNKGDYDWRQFVEASLEKTPAQDEQEENARQEKTKGLEELFRARISVLVGPAGTGKTTLLRALCAIPKVSEGNVLLLAPTGKARVRLEQGTGRRGAKTIAQYLLHRGRYDGSTGRYFLSDSTQKPEEEQKTVWKTVIIDECSMLTEEQLAAVLQTLEGVERLVLVGDPRQLPPIGAGRPFVDIVEQLRPADLVAFPRVSPGYVELLVTRRQRSAPQKAKGTEDVLREDLRLAQWFSGRPPDAAADELWSTLEGNGSSHVKLVRWDTPEELEHKLIQQLVEHLGLKDANDEAGFAASLGGQIKGSKIYFSHADDGQQGAAASVHAWQILSPIRASRVGVESLNRAVQTRFRSWTKALLHLDAGYKREIPKPMGGQAITYGDKVISLRNGHRYNSWTTWPKRERIYVANGDLGVVTGQRKFYKWPFGTKLPWKMEAEFQSNPGKPIEYFTNEFEGDAPLELAYALTVHKTQGSQFGITFLVLPSPCRLLSRELLYTALTRHEDKIILLHQGLFRDLWEYSTPKNSDIAGRMTNLFRQPRPVAIEPSGPVRTRRQFLDENLIHRTARNEFVRSKSEVIIANELFHKGRNFFTYHYEQPLMFPDGIERRPDFTINYDDAGRIFYWEHLGMLGVEEYRRRWEAKLQGYRALGILPHDEGDGENGTLIITRDDARGGIDSFEVARIIDKVILS